jgi:hypothetical protein
MSRRAAIGVINWNWRRAMRDETNEIIQASLERIKEANKDKFRVSLLELKDADPNWESWYDKDENVPCFIRWPDIEMVDGIIARMMARVKEIKDNQQ